MIKSIDQFWGKMRQDAVNALLTTVYDDAGRETEKKGTEKKNAIQGRNRLSWFCIERSSMLSSSAYGLVSSRLGSFRSRRYWISHFSKIPRTDRDLERQLDDR